MLAASLLLLREQPQPPVPARPSGGSGGGGGGPAWYFGPETCPDPTPREDRVSSRRAALLAQQRLLAIQRAREQIERAMAMGMLYGATLERMAAQEAAVAAAQEQAASAALAAHEAAAEETADPDWCKRASWIAELELGDVNPVIALATIPSVSIIPAPFYQQPWFKWVVIGGIGVLGLLLLARERQRRPRSKRRRSKTKL